uniref:U3 small nucleolar ribonucleoprotein protein IMP4 isoform X1 n=1 Tax=Agelaius phoeniceus TaxID=39638 RepID=UPI0023ECF87E|nr:U3 small nucleolar ribonucleoprotein protein IMP4 isoform X1 [Agelaius phoeniceus]
MGGGDAGRCRRVRSIAERSDRDHAASPGPGAPGSTCSAGPRSSSSSGQRERRESLKRALDENRLLPTELRHEALALQKELEFDFQAPGETGDSQDDEYRWAGLEAPKVMVTTSRDPSARLRLFAKELCLLLPGARRMNRGRAELGALVAACRAAGVTDLLVLHETRGRPDGLTVSHLPHGPTAHFTLSGAVLRQEVGGLGGAPLAAPHLLLLRLDSTLGKRPPRGDLRQRGRRHFSAEPRVPAPGAHGGAGGGGTPIPAEALPDPPGDPGAGGRGRRGVALAPVHGHGPQTPPAQRHLSPPGPPQVGPTCTPETTSAAETPLDRPRHGWVSHNRFLFFAIINGFCLYRVL